MLQGNFALHDVRDVEGFCARLVQRSRFELSFHDSEDLLAYLVETAWELSLIYERGDPKYPPRFSVYATNILGLRIIDWHRQRFGRKRWVFDEPAAKSMRGYTLERERPVFTELEQAERSIGDHGPGDCSTDLMRILRPGDRARVGSDDERGKASARRAA